MAQNSLWFKTRTGLANVTTPASILTFHYTKGKYWYIFARLKCGTEFKMKNIFGRKISMDNPCAYLAFFNDAPGVEIAIGECMAHIEQAIRTNAEFCDLSQFGDAEAWKKAPNWRLIEWPTGQL